MAKNSVQQNHEGDNTHLTGGAMALALAALAALVLVLAPFPALEQEAQQRSSWEDRIFNAPVAPVDSLTDEERKIRWCARTLWRSWSNPNPGRFNRSWAADFCAAFVEL